MGAAAGSVVGRERELAAIDAFLHADTRALLIDGEAGIGKTTLLNEVVRAAKDEGWRVLSVSAAEQEAKLAFAVLGDLLLEPFQEIAGELAPPQRSALEVALLRVESERVRPDRRAVGLATSETIRRLAETGRTLIAVDDVQWVDTPSAQALAFAIRRSTGVPLKVAAAVRTAPGLRDVIELERAFPDQRLERVHVGPLGASALHRILRRRGDAITAPLASRVHEASGGNPFFALELVRAVGRDGVEPAAGEPLPLPDELDGLLRQRLRLLTPEARHLLLLAAAAGRPSTELVRRLSGSPARVADLLEEAERHEVITTTRDRIRFTHPLLGSAVYALASPDDRREAHRRLSRALDDPIACAWHLALATTRPDPDAASTLDEAAEVAESRGAPAVAAQLSELASRLTPPEDPGAARVRSIAAAEHLFAAGDVSRAEARLEEIAAAAPRGVPRADALHRQCHLAWNDVKRVRELVTEGLAELDDQAPGILLANLHRALAWVELWGGDPRLAGPHFERAEALAEAAGDPAEVALCLNGQAYLDFFLGRPTAMELIRRALPLAEPRGIDHYLTHPRRTLGQLQLWMGALDQARTVLELDYQQVVDRGHLGLIWENLSMLTELEVRAGSWELAERYAAEGLDAVTDVPYERAREVLLWSSASVQAHLGKVDVARAHASEGLELAERHEDRWYVLANASVLGFLELSLGDPAAAHEQLAPMVQLAERMGLQEPAIFPFLPDEIEALIALNELDQAHALLERLTAQAAALDRALALAGAARCRSLLAAARGDLEGATAAVEEALEHHRRIPQPFDLGRTLLVQGQVLRRRKRKRSAREALERALETFERLGARLWAEKARAELGRIGGRAPSPTELTPTERQVADLVGRGMSNRDVAAALFMSEHTVRANLRRIYAKLGVRSRAELGRRLHADAPGATGLD